MEFEDTVILEPEDTLIGKFQKERTDAISDMFDNKDEHGIYPTTQLFIRLDNCVRELLEISFKAGQEEERTKVGRELVQAGHFESIKEYLDEIGGFRMLNALTEGTNEH